MQGQGVYVYSNGDIYNGAFLAGKRHGQGSYHFKASWPLWAAPAAGFAAQCCKGVSRGAGGMAQHALGSGQCVHTLKHICTHACTLTHAHTHAHLHTSNTRAHAHTAHLNTCTYAHTHAQHTHTCTRTHTHTHTHGRTHARTAGDVLPAGGRVGGGRVLQGPLGDEGRQHVLRVFREDGGAGGCLLMAGPLHVACVAWHGMH